MAQANCHSISSLVAEKDRYINSLNSAKSIVLVCVFTLQSENPCVKASATALYQAYDAEPLAQQVREFLDLS